MVSKALSNPVVVKDCQGEGRLSDPPWADESNWREVLREIDDFFYEVATSETSPWWWWRQFSNDDTARI